MKRSAFVLSLVVFCLLGVPGLLTAQEPPVPLPGDEPVSLPGDDLAPLPSEDADVPAVAAPSSAWSQALEFRGYVENTMTLEYLKQEEEEILLNAGRVRLNIEGDPDEWWDFGIGLVGVINKGATKVSLTDYLPDDLQSCIFPEVKDLFQYQLEEEDIFVQEAFGTLYTDHVRLRVGRHKFYSGTGYAYNPIDLFNVKDPLDPTYETGGLDALLLSLNFPHQTELEGLVRYDDQLETTDYLLRLKTYLRGWDLALQYTHSLQSRVDWEALNSEDALAAFAQGGSFEAFTREFRWHLIAAEFAGELWDWGVYGEGGYALIDAPEEAGTLRAAADDHERLLLGLDHTFAMQLYVMLEYLRLGQGRTDTAEITLNDRLAYLNGEILSINRDTLFSGLSYPLTDLLDFSLYAIIGCNDVSVLLNPWLVYDLRPGLTFSLSLNLPIGDEKGQNGKSGASGFARLTFNF
jgi:hypothetical protein